MTIMAHMSSLKAYPNGEKHQQWGNANLQLKKFS